MDNVEHPVPLVVVALLCSPLLLFTARWFFDDLESFLREIGYREIDDVWWKLIRIEMNTSFAWVKIVAFVGTYAIVVGLVYYAISQVFW